jgi:hypothetical protein
MKTGNRNTRLLAFFIAVIIIMSFSRSAFALDDGARSYWHAREGTNVVSFQTLRIDIEASGSQQFAPGQYIYANSNTEASVFIASWASHLTVLNRPSTFAFSLAGGDVDVDVNTTTSPPQFLPPGVTPGSSFSQSSSGFGDPNVQFDMNLFGTPRLKSNVDLLNYEPTWTIDAAALLAFPIGEYDDDKLVNLGLNRWWGRVALPFKYHFGVFASGYMSSFEVVPSVWLFAENDDFIGQKMENDPIWQLEAHLTHDFTRTFFGSLDLLYRAGFQSEINGIEVGDEVDVGNVGFTLNYQVTDNVTIRTAFSSNVFGDDDLDNSVLRLQFVYGWNPTTENAKRLKSGH